MLEATALPAEPPPLPISSTFNQYKDTEIPKQNSFRLTTTDKVTKIFHILPRPEMFRTFTFEVDVDCFLSRRSRTFSFLYLGRVFDSHARSFSPDQNYEARVHFPTRTRILSIFFYLWLPALCLYLSVFSPLSFSLSISVFSSLLSLSLSLSLYLSLSHTHTHAFLHRHTFSNKHTRAHRSPTTKMSFWFLVYLMVCIKVILRYPHLALGWWDLPVERLLLNSLGICTIKLFMEKGKIS